jgi:hypothetical protein
MGFEVGLETWRYSWYFVRADHPLGLNQWAGIGFAGRRREAVAGRIWISATRYMLVDGLCQSQPLNTLAFDPERGQTIIETRKEAADWERRFADVAPRQAEILSALDGPALLERSAAARQAAERYRDRLPRAESLYAQIVELKRRIGPDLVAAAERLVEWPGIQQLHGTEEVFELACLCILGYEGEVEGRRGSFQLGAPRSGIDVMSRLRQPVAPPSNELRWRIKFLADWLIDQWNGKEGSGLSLSPRL